MLSDEGLADMIETLSREGCPIRPVKALPALPPLADRFPFPPLARLSSEGFPRSFLVPAPADEAELAAAAAERRSRMMEAPLDASLFVGLVLADARDDAMDAAMLALSELSLARYPPLLLPLTPLPEATNCL